MFLAKHITIIIPALNEEKYIGNILDDISLQAGVDGMKVIISHGESTDNTLEVIRKKQLQHKHLNIILSTGGAVSVARNNGSDLCETKYICFIDADVRLFATDTLLKSYGVLEGKYKNKRLLTCRLKSYSDDWRAKLAFWLYNHIHRILIKKYPFAIGAYFFLSSEDFMKYGKFNENSDNSEDFLFSQNFKPSEFFVLDEYIGQDDRRFKKMGYWGMAKHLLGNLIRYVKNGREEFKKKSNYWK